MLLGLLGLVALSAALDPTLDTEWEDWKGLHGKTYPEGDEASRRAVWEENWRMIEQHNWEASQGKHSYRLGMNPFGDMTDKEFDQKVSCSMPTEAGPPAGHVVSFNTSATTRLPRRKDWRQEGYVTRVKNQGRCGSCWAFAAVGALEALHFKQTRRLVALSEQHLVDCFYDKLNRGCEGGYPYRALRYAQRNGGLSSERSYPYEERRRWCRAQNARKVNFRVSEVKLLPPGDERGLEHAVAEIGPVAVTLQVNSKYIQFYRSGIFTGVCESLTANHVVLVVGYDVDRFGHRYWIVKNSHSKAVGIKGYWHLPKGINYCGIANGATYPI